MKSKINMNSITLVLLLTLTILPSWFQIAGHIASSILSLLMLAILFITHRVSVCKIRDSLPVWIWLGIRMLLYACHAEYVRMVTLSCMVIIIAIVILSYIKDERSFLRAIDILVAFSTFVCLIGIIEGLTGFNAFLLLNNSGIAIARNVERLGIMRIIVFTTQTTHFALYAGMVSFITLYRMECLKNGKKKNKLFIMLFIQWISMLLTLSRTALLCYAMCIFIYLLKKGVAKFLKYVLLGCIIAILLIVLGQDTFIGKTMVMLLGAVVPGMSGLVKGVATAEAENAFGDRFKLYAWVWNNVQSSIWVGMGEKTEFNQEITVTTINYTYQAIKTSIEVHYLYCLYHFGIIGMLSEIVMYLRCLYVAFKNKCKDSLIGENRISFGFISFLCILFNLIAWFGIMQGEEANMLYIILFLWFAYKRMLNYKKEGI